MADPQPSPGSKTEGASPTLRGVGPDLLMTDVLRGVSRSFYLTLRVLPRSLQEPVGLAYLLARAGDTIADTRLLPPHERLQRLLTFRRQVEGPTSPDAIRDLGLGLADMQSVSYERTLLASLPEVFDMLEASPESDRTSVRSVVVTLTRGMEIDLTTFPSEDSGTVTAFKHQSELDHYVYYVAGCVGEFWTAITMAHITPLKRWDAERMSRIGVGFGKALQLTNVLRDLPKDLRIGRCYLPETELDQLGLNPETLLNPSVGGKARPALVGNIETALTHYRAAEEYLRAIPRRCLRLRLAVVWPILIGLGTLAQLARNEDWLDPAKPSKVSRRWVYRMMVLSLPCASSDALLSGWIARLVRRVESAL